LACQNLSRPPVQLPQPVKGFEPLAIENVE
jgi:hypothetical protein